MAGLVLIDTSAWIEFFRSRSGACGDHISELILSDRAAICGVVEAEIRAGLRPAERDRVLGMLGELRYLADEWEDWLRAGDLLHGLRTKGVTIPLSDALIGAIALRDPQTQVLSLDAHFRRIPRLNLVKL